jgi:ATP-dependent NAD(P)H-hydrate dehydratase
MYVARNLRDDIQKTVFQPITDLLPRLHVLVVGPGLSRDKCMLEAARHAIQEAKKRNMPIVIDADGLYLIQHQPDVIHGYTKAVLTPNIAEFKRLCQALVSSRLVSHKTYVLTTYLRILLTFL